MGSREFKFGLTTFDLENSDFQEQLLSLLAEKIEPDFVILHYAGIINTALRYFRFFLKTIRHYRVKSFYVIINRFTQEKTSGDFKITISRHEQDAIDSFLKRTMIIKTKGINDRSTIKRIGKLGKSVIVCNSGVLRDKILSLPDTVFLNIHAARLPLYRGMNNIEWALFENNPVYVTIHRISKGIDEGDILYQEEIEVKNKNLSLIEDYRHYCFSKSNEVLGKVVRKLFNNEISYIPQDKKHLPLMQYYSMHPILKKRLQEKLLSSEFH